MIPMPFRLELTFEQVSDMLKVAYQIEVESRNKIYRPDEETIKHIEQAAKWLTDDSNKFGLLLCGNVGNGKTTLVKAIKTVISLLYDDNANYEKYRLNIISAKDIARDIREETIIEKIKSHYLLAIDDVGQEPYEVVTFGNIVNPIDEVVSYRYDKMLTTIITTNLSPEQLKEKYKLRLYDRLREMMYVIAYNNNSYR